MSSYERHYLGSDAITFMRECLVQGHTLGNLLLNRQLDKGVIFAPVPLTLQPDNVKNFRHGPLFPTTLANVESWDQDEYRVVPVPTTNHILEQLVQTYLAENHRRVCILEDALATPSDSYLNTLDVKIGTLNNEVYYILLSNASRREVRITLKQAVNPHPGLIAMITTMSGYDFQVRRGAFTTQMLNDLSQRADTIIVGAYHGEGYMVWRPS